jgi:hypothetical protein
LTEAEIERLRKAAGENRHGFRDAAMILVAFRHGTSGVNAIEVGSTDTDRTRAAVHSSTAQSMSLR